MSHTTEHGAREPSQDRWVDEIMNWADDLFLEGKFEVVDKKLAKLDPVDLGLTLCITWLTITFAAKPKLKNRSAFFDKCRQFVRLVDPEREKGHLGGLE